jgi:outer membrane protein
MKRLFTLLVVALATLSTQAQNKIGYISIDAVVAVMPETQKANAELKEYNELLAKQYEEMNKDLEDKSAAFIKDSIKMNATEKEFRRDDIIKLSQDVNNFQNTAQEKMRARYQEKLAPVQDKAIEAIKSVAKKNGYTYVLDAQVVITGPQGDDLLPLVKKELGIKEPAATPAKATDAPKAAPKTPAKQ